jgi:hypothetical protein
VLVTGLGLVGVAIIQDVVLLVDGTSFDSSEDYSGYYHYHYHYRYGGYSYDVCYNIHVPQVHFHS